MSPEAFAAIVFIGLAVLMAIAVVIRLLPKKLKTDSFAADWKQIQDYCRDKALWPQALIEADALLNKALKRRKFKGKSMGERMVSAQRLFTSSDKLWYAHNLYKKVIAEPDVRLKEADVKAALVGFRQALRDLGALDDGRQQKDG